MNFRIWLNKFKIPGAIWWSKRHLYLPETDIEIYVVIGKALVLPKIEKPTRE